jgi:hypothetical protein
MSRRVLLFPLTSDPLTLLFHFGLVEALSIIELFLAYMLLVFSKDQKFLQSNNRTHPLDPGISLVSHRSRLPLHSFFGRLP